MKLKINIRPEADTKQICAALIESMDDGVWLWNIAQGRFDAISPAAQALFSTELDIYNQDPEKWVYLIHPDDRKEALFATTKTLFTLNKTTIQYRIQNENGTYRWVKDERKLIFDTDGNLFQVFGQITDITEQKNTNSNLKSGNCRTK